MLFDVPNFSLYLPSNPMQVASMLFNSKTGKEPLKIQNATLEVVLKIRTNLKLVVDNIDEKTMESKYLGRLRDEEFHFVRFEGCLPPVEMTLDSLR